MPCEVDSCQPIISTKALRSIRLYVLVFNRNYVKSHMLLTENLLGVIISNVTNLLIIRPISISFSCVWFLKNRDNGLKGRLHKGIKDSTNYEVLGSAHSNLDETHIFQNICIRDNTSLVEPKAYTPKGRANKRFHRYFCFDNRFRFYFLSSFDKTSLAIWYLQLCLSINLWHVVCLKFGCNSRLDTISRNK